jgi:hypothetical protein
MAGDSLPAGIGSLAILGFDSVRGCGSRWRLDGHYWSFRFGRRRQGGGSKRIAVTRDG